MKILFSEPFKKDYNGLSTEVQEALDKALDFLIINPRYPSLRAKKLPQTSIWYARITRGYRFTFQFQNDAIILRRAGTHSILDKERKS